MNEKLLKSEILSSDSFDKEVDTNDYGEVPDFSLNNTKSVMINGEKVMVVEDNKFDSNEMDNSLVKESISEDEKGEYYIDEAGKKQKFELVDDDSVYTETEEVKTKLELSPTEEYLSPEAEKERLQEEVMAETPPEAEKENIEKREKTGIHALKVNLKKTEKAYYDALALDHQNKKILGKALDVVWGGKESEDVKKARLDFDNATNEYQHVYQKIVDRINHYKNPEEHKTIKDLEETITERHIKSVSKNEAELRSDKISESTERVKEKIANFAKKNPKIAKFTKGVGYGFLGVGAIFNPLSLAASLAANWGANQFIKRAESKNEEIISNLTDLIEEKDSLVNKRNAYKEGNDRVSKFKKAKLATSLARYIIAADGIIEGLSQIDNPAEITSEKIDKLLTDSVNNLLNDNEKPNFGSVQNPTLDTEAFNNRPDFSPIQDNFGTPETVAGVDYPNFNPDSSVPEAASVLENQQIGPDFAAEKASEGLFELKHEVVRGETLSGILNETLNEKLSSGEIKLPQGVTENSISNYIYQSFPEMTNASGIEPRLTPDQWRELGVSSGDPNLIRPGETINVSDLVKHMWGNTESPVSNFGTPETVAGVDYPNYNPETITSETNTISESKNIGYEQTAVNEKPNFGSVQNPTLDTEAFNNRPSLESVESVPVAVETSVEVENPPNYSDSKPEEVVVSKPQEEVAPNQLSQERIQIVQSYYDQIDKVDSKNYNLRSVLANDILADSKKQDLFKLPDEVSLKLKQDPRFIYELVDKHLPELKGSMAGNVNDMSHSSRDIINSLPSEARREMGDITKILRTVERFSGNIERMTDRVGFDKSALSESDWRQLGIRSGDPTELRVGYKIDVGEIKKILLQKIGEDYGQVVVPKYVK